MGSFSSPAAGHVALLAGAGQGETGRRALGRRPARGRAWAGRSTARGRGPPGRGRPPAAGSPAWSGGRRSTPGPARRTSPAGSRASSRDALATPPPAAGGDPHTRPVRLRALRRLDHDLRRAAPRRGPAGRPVAGARARGAGEPLAVSASSDGQARRTRTSPATWATRAPRPFGALRQHGGRDAEDVDALVPQSAQASHAASEGRTPPRYRGRRSRRVGVGGVTSDAHDVPLPTAGPPPAPRATAVPAPPRALRGSGPARPARPGGGALRPRLPWRRQRW